VGTKTVWKFTGGRGKLPFGDKVSNRKAIGIDYVLYQVGCFSRFCRLSLLPGGRHNSTQKNRFTSSSLVVPGGSPKNLTLTHGGNKNTHTHRAQKHCDALASNQVDSNPDGRLGAFKKVHDRGSNLETQLKRGLRGKPPSSASFSTWGTPPPPGHQLRLLKTPRNLWGDPRFGKILANRSATGRCVPNGQNSPKSPERA